MLERKLINHIWYCIYVCLVVGAKWIINIGLGSSVVKFLTNTAEVPSSIRDPAIYFFVHLPILPFL